MIQLTYTKHINTYDPVAVSWQFGGKSVELEFKAPIEALFSNYLDAVVVEVYDENALNFYSLNGSLLSSEPLPAMAHYQFRGLNKSKESKTGIALLFHPADESVGNQWRDTEQFELTEKAVSRIGKRLGIYR